MERMKVVSTFSNIGVGEALLHRLGLHVSVASEMDAKRCQVYRRIYPSSTMVEGDITDRKVARRYMDLAANPFLMIATPPCQGFSSLNNETEKGGKKDARNDLVRFSMELAAEMAPCYFLFENVPRVARAFGEGAIEAFADKVMPGYQVSFGIVDAADWGTPQTRKRAIALFSRKDMPKWVLPERRARRKRTVREAIGMFPTLESGERCDRFHRLHYAGRHSQHHIDWMRHTPTGSSAWKNKDDAHKPHVVEKDGTTRAILGFGNTYKRMSWDDPAPTIIQGCHMVSSSNTVHPGMPRGDGTWSDARTLSVLECMVLMGLPSWWRLPGDLPYKQAVEMLGEGFCPRVVLGLVKAIPEIGGG